MARRAVRISPKETAPVRESESETVSSAPNTRVNDAIGDDVRAIIGSRDLLAVMRRAEDIHEDFMATLRPRWERNYKALRNEHFQGSKYRSDAYKARSKLFVPKTRVAVRKNMATAASAMFSTDDIVSVKAEFEDDPRYQASASVLNHLLNYRLDRSSSRGGIPWFLVSMGACYDAQATAMCCSKQYWEFEEVVIGTEDVQVPATFQHPDTGQEIPMVDPTTGQPVMRTEKRPRRVVMADRPMIVNIPPENVIGDPAAPWYDRAQKGAYWSVAFPQTVGQFKSFIGQNSPKVQIEWLNLDDGAYAQAANLYDSSGVRIAREGDGGTRLDEREAETDLDLRIIWPRENFIRVDGIDLCYWSIGSVIYASTVRPTIDCYPYFFGARPYVYGTSVVEPHVAVSMSPVESWQPTQQEMNDVTNLRLDAVKQAIEPIAKIRQGSIFDTAQLRNRGAPGANIIVREPDDLTFERWPDATSGSYQEMNYLSTSFDDQAGSFSGSSVQTNRQLNETVGGMRLMAGAANALTEFDLRVWVETWVEPVLRHVLLLIQAFESDETALRVAGERAKLRERYGIDRVTDEDLAAECCLRVNVGIGAADPMQGLAKLKMAVEMIGAVAQFADRDVQVVIEEFIREVMGKAGFKDGMRFVQLGKHGEKKQSPEAMKAQMDAHAKAAQIASNEKIATERNQTQIALEQMQERFEGMMKTMEHSIGALQSDADRASREGMAREGVMSRERQGDKSLAVSTATKMAGGEQSARARQWQQTAAKPSPGTPPAGDPLAQIAAAVAESTRQSAATSAAVAKMAAAIERMAGSPAR